jgi:hypothetical protein
VIGEYTRECLAIEVARHLLSDDVLDRLTDVFVEHGPPDRNSPLSIAASRRNALRSGLAASVSPS